MKDSAMDCPIYRDFCECFRLPDEKYFDDKTQIYLEDYKHDLSI